MPHLMIYSDPKTVLSSFPSSQSQKEWEEGLCDALSSTGVIEKSLIKITYLNPIHQSYKTPFLYLCLRLFPRSNEQCLDIKKNLKKYLSSSPVDLFFEIEFIDKDLYGVFKASD